MTEFLQDLLNRMCHQDAPRTNSADSISFKAHRDAEEVTDLAVLDEAKTAARAGEPNARRRSALYFLIGKIGRNLGRLEVADFLIRQTRTEKDKYVLGSMLDRIGEIPKSAEADLSPILERLKDERSLVRRAAITALKPTHSSAAEEALISLLRESEDPFDLTCANATLNKIGTPRAIPALEAHLQSRKRDVKFSAARAIEEIQKRMAG